jgi:MoxR-like ATPase
VWDFGGQMLEIRVLEASGAGDRAAMRQAIFSEAFLLKRPLLQAIEPRERPVVLLIDEIDRADEEFEGYLLEVLSEYQITVPELGTIRAVTPPRVVLTSNRTREIHDALKRRCVYQWIEYPSYERELAIVTAAHPRASGRLAERVTALVQELRSADLYKVPGISETLDWVAALVALDQRDADVGAIEETLGVVLKAREDVAAIRGDRLRTVLTRAMARGVQTSG